jgi:L-lysine exporter family protein LysE/ArgO
MNTEIILTGVFLSLSLIVAVGPQNVFVFSTAVRGKHIGSVVFISIVCDSLLASLGIMGIGPALASLPGFSRILLLLGVVWLAYCTLRSIEQAFKASSLQESRSDPRSTIETLVSAFAFSLLNPHAYLDSLFLIGTFSAGILESLRFSFFMGVVGGIVLWFISLSVIGRLSAPLLKTQKAWRVIHGAIALSLLWSIFTLSKL